MDINELCGAYLHNWFEVDGLGRSEKKTGTFEVKGGAIDLSDFLPIGKYYRIVGSDFNDGAHKYGENDLEDETFTGEIRKLWIPDHVFAKLEEMNDWLAKYGETINNPYTSESFGGYSYTKAGAGDSSESGYPMSTAIQRQFGGWIEKMRKV